MVCHGHSGHAHLAVVKILGNCPVAGLIFPGYKFGINQAFLIPFPQLGKRFLHFRLYAGEFHFPVLHCIEQVLSACAPEFLHGDRTVCAENSIHYGIGETKGIVFAVSVRILFLKCTDRCLKFFDGGGDFFNAHFLQPVFAPYKNGRPRPVQGRGFQNILLAFIAGIYESGIIRIIFLGYFHVCRYFFQYFIRNGGQNPLYHIAGYICSIFHTHDIRHISAGELGA